MSSKLNEKNILNKKEKSIDLSKETNIFETTYEKVLAIINKVIDFIKKASNSSQKLIDDLEWVIKVITNKSLYSYEVNKEKLLLRSSKYNEFINFVTKYNEEVLELNKRHILVSSLINIGKRRELLLKPSLCLKKILPDEFKSMNYQEEKEKRERKKNSIVQIGNIILNIYYKAKKEQKNENKEDKEDKNESIDINENKFKKKNIIINKSRKNKENEKNNKIQDIDFHSSKNIFVNEKILDNLKKIKKLKKNKSYKNTICKVNLSESNSNKLCSTDMRIKLKNKVIEFNRNHSHNRDFTNDTNLSKNKKLSLNSIKKAMVNYYATQNIINYNKNKRNKKKIFYFEKELSTDFNLKNNTLSKINYFDGCSLSNFKDKDENIISKNKKNDVIRIKKIDNKHKRNNTTNLETVSFSSNKLLSIKKINDNKNSKRKNKEKKEEIIKIKILIEKYFEEIKSITEIDFNIFNFKKIVGYKNVLPIMGYVILKTLGLFDSKIISLKKIDSFLYAVSNGYKESILYHNSMHGADVVQTLCVYFINSNAEEICETTVLDLLGMVISAMGHDLGHPGFNNNFHINASTDLAITYNDISCLENLHTSFLFKILRKDENNIFENLNTQNYKSIRKRMISQILATDMAHHPEVVSLIRAKIKACENEGQKSFNLLSGNEKTKFDEQQILLNYMMHTADLGHNTKKFEISQQWIKLLCEEFWIQGDMEKSKGLPVSFLCDRDKIDVPASQVGFLKGFIVNTFDCLANIFPKLNYTMENAANNIKQWQNLLDQHRVTGWTPKKD